MHLKTYAETGSTDTSPLPKPSPLAFLNPVPYFSRAMNSLEGLVKDSPWMIMAAFCVAMGCIMLMGNMMGYSYIESIAPGLWIKFPGSDTHKLFGLSSRDPAWSIKSGKSIGKPDPKGHPPCYYYVNNDDPNKLYPIPPNIQFAGMPKDTPKPPTSAS